MTDFEHRGVAIELMGNGMFKAVIGSGDEAVTVCHDRLDDARKAIDKVKSKERRRRVRPSVPVYFYKGGSDVELIEWRGFQVNSGHMLVTNQEGEKKRYKLPGWAARKSSTPPPHLIPVDLYDGRVKEAAERFSEAKKATECAAEELREAVTAVGVPLPSAYDVERSAEDAELAMSARLENAAAEKRRSALVVDGPTPRTEGPADD